LKKEKAGGVKPARLGVFVFRKRTNGSKFKTSDRIREGRFCHLVIAFTNKACMTELSCAVSRQHHCFVFVIGEGIVQKLPGCDAEAKDQQQPRGQ